MNLLADMVNSLTSIAIQPCNRRFIMALPIALIGAVANALLTKKNGQGLHALSMTKLGAQVVAASTAPAWIDWIGPALAGDWAARGQLFGVVVGYVLVLWGRWRAEQR